MVCIQNLSSLTLVFSSKCILEIQKLPCQANFASNRNILHYNVREVGINKSLKLKRSFNDVAVTCILTLDSKVALVICIICYHIHTKDNHYAKQ